MMQVEPASDEWIFGGAFRVLHDRKIDRSVSYDIELIRDATEPLIGRMRLRFRAPVRGRSFYMETALPRISIIEIAPVRWAGAPFPGVANLNHSFRDLEVVVRNRRAEWRYALDNFKGIYVWNDRATGKSYVGSATAENGGLWARLSDYINTGGHGNNADLIRTRPPQGERLHPQQLQLCASRLLPSRVDDQHVLRREEYWKQVLSTRSHGYNDN
jgi:hypothetical protein